ncbi:MAG: hypothetical protein A2219_07950 [Elusimicrobia bacterium RIFOXYA2_FULL_50_26]|nr:MAG: hypothetical protein A2219_07950 [Elusimicrobia bacterium RIFOXYA2_FULL_50_26]OGS24807.1 MAG: hypothetical protein A2314_02030 [Elusimicrobia bacterium RIFOXYB2_FULL_50_12]
MLAIIVGLVFMVLGLLGLLAWWPDFIAVFKGFVPIMIMIGGLIAVVAGATSVMDSMEPKDDSSSKPEEKKED